MGKGFNIYSLEKEMALGKQLSEEVSRQVKLVDDPLITEYINRLGHWRGTQTPRCRSLFR